MTGCLEARSDKRVESEVRARKDESRTAGSFDWKQRLVHKDRRATERGHKDWFDGPCARARIPAMTVAAHHVRPGGRPSSVQQYCQAGRYRCLGSSWAV